MLIRHASTDRTQADKNPGDLKECSTQRNLTDNGRLESQGIGAGIRARKIPIGQVLHGAYCRTTQTALLAFGRGEVSEALLAGGFTPAAGLPTPTPPEQRIATLKQMLGTAPPAGVNTVLVTHSEVIRNAVGLNDLEEGETLIYKPDGKGGFSLTGRVLAAEWPVAAAPVPAPPAPSTPASPTRLPVTGESISWLPVVTALWGALLVVVGVRVRKLKA